MKILFISNLFPPNAVGGYERLCAHVSDNFSKQHDVVVLTSNYGKIVSFEDKYGVYRKLTLLTNHDDIYRSLEISNGERQKINDENIKTLNDVIRLESPDLIFAWNLYFLDISFLDELQKLKLKTIFFLTDNWLISFLNPNFLPIYFSKITESENCGIIKKMKILVRNLYFFFHRRNDKFNLDSDVIFSSQFMQKLYKEADINFRKSEIIYNGVELKGFAEKEIDRNYVFNERIINILFVGRLVHIKGAHVLLDAFSRLILKYGKRNLHLTIIGDSIDIEYVGKLHRQIKEFGINEFVNFKEFVKEEDLFEEFQKYDIYIFPSLYEPFSLILIQALAAGIPTIASDAGGNTEIVIDESTGLLYDKFSASDLARKMNRLLSDKDLLRKISLGGREKAKEFELDEMCNKIKSSLGRNYEK